MIDMMKTNVREVVSKTNVQISPIMSLRRSPYMMIKLDRKAIIVSQNQRLTGIQSPIKHAILT